MLRTGQTGRNIGIELLRIVSMFMIMTLHVLGEGGVLNNTNAFSLSNQTGWLVEFLFIGAVNMFAIITGFVMINARYRIERLLELVAQILFFSWGALIIDLVINKGHIGLMDIAMALVPFRFRFWYVNAYIVMFMLLPVINKGLKAISQRTFLIMLFAILGVTSVLDTLWVGDRFMMIGGYSAMWLIVMYFIGAYFKLFGFPKWATNGRMFATYVIASIGTLLITDLGSIVLAKLTGQKLTILSKFMNYNQPLTVIAAVAVFILFTQLNFKQGKLQRGIVKIAPFAFGAYVFQVTPLVFDKITGNFAWIGQLNIFLFVLVSLGSGLAWLIVGMLLDWIRAKIFAQFDVVGRLKRMVNSINGKILRNIM